MPPPLGVGAAQWQVAPVKGVLTNRGSFFGWALLGRTSRRDWMFRSNTLSLTPHR